MGQAKLLLAILFVAAAAGGWNYHRNLGLEAQQPRPFRTYSEAQLQSLIGAYEQDARALDSRFRATKEVRVGEDGGVLLDQRVEAFERASAQSARVRSLAGDLSEREAALADLQKELAARREPAYAVHLRRLVSF